MTDFRPSEDTTAWMADPQEVRVGQKSIEQSERLANEDNEREAAKWREYSDFTV